MESQRAGLFYRSGNKMMAVDIATRPSFTAGRPRMLFDRPYVTIQLPQTIPAYDVSPDGQRFLMLKEGERLGAARRGRGELAGRPEASDARRCPIASSVTIRLPAIKESR